MHSRRRYGDDKGMISPIFCARPSAFTYTACWLLGAGLALGLSGCATILTGSSENLVVRSHPPEARVTINGVYSGLSPVTVYLKRDRDYRILVEKPGYEDSTLTIRRKFNWVALSNLINPICWGIDWATAGIWRLDHNEAVVELERLEGKGG